MDLNLKDWVYIAWIALCAIVTITGLILSFVKKLAKQKGCAEVAKVADEGLNLIDTIKMYMVKAESMVGLSGEMKKDYVITKVNQKCLNSGEKFDEEQTSQIIETLIDLSKNVNV